MPEIYSHSKLSTFEQCRLKYKYQHIDKIKTKEQTIETFLGKIVHDSLEWLYLEVKNRKIPSIENLINYYTHQWTEKYKESIKIVKQLTAKDYFDKGIRFLIDYYFKHQPFKDNTLEVEKKIIFSLDEKGEYKIQGYIDRLVYNLEKNQLEVHDYKTANSLPTKEKIENDRQLALYSIAIKEEFGKEKEVLLIWHYLAHNQKIVSKRTNEQLEKLKQEIIELINEIKSAKKFPPNKSVLCGWCEYKSICPEFTTQKRIDDFAKSESEEELLDIWN